MYRNGTTADGIEVKNYSHVGIGVPLSAANARIVNCTITGPSNYTTMGIWRDMGRADSTSALTIDNNTVQSTGIYATGGQVTITNNQISGEPNPGGGQMDIGSAYSTNTVATITGNNVHDGGTPGTGGIEMGGGTFTVTNNTVRNHGLGGIGVGHRVISATITGNTVSNCGRNTTDRNNPQCRSGIYVGYNAMNVDIENNHCFDDQPTKTQTYGIILCPVPQHIDPRFPPNAMSHVRVSGNDFRGNLSGGILDLSGACDKVIADNLIR
jgi:hypothetical protein